MTKRRAVRKTAARTARTSRAASTHATRRPSTHTPTGGPAATFLYIESSALLAALLEQDSSAIDALRTDGQRVTSALTFAEASRAIVRARATGRLSADDERAAIRALQTFERRCAVIAVTDAVLTRAGRPFPVELIRTLDAIHLATAELLAEPPQLVTIVTRDIRVRDNAKALGYATA